MFLEQFVGSPIVFGLYLIPALTVNARAQVCASCAFTLTYRELMRNNKCTVRFATSILKEFKHDFIVVDDGSRVSHSTQIILPRSVDDLAPFIHPGCLLAFIIGLLTPACPHMCASIFIIRWSCPDAKAPFPMPPPSWPGLSSS